MSEAHKGRGNFDVFDPANLPSQPITSRAFQLDNFLLYYTPGCAIADQVVIYHIIINSLSLPNVYLPD